MLIASTFVAVFVRAKGDEKLFNDRADAVLAAIEQHMQDPDTLLFRDFDVSQPPKPRTPSSAGGDSGLERKEEEVTPKAVVGLSIDAVAPLLALPLKEQARESPTWVRSAATWLLSGAMEPPPLYPTVPRTGMNENRFTRSGYVRSGVVLDI